MNIDIVNMICMYIFLKNMASMSICMLHIYIYIFYLVSEDHGPCPRPWYRRFEASPRARPGVVGVGDFPFFETMNSWETVAFIFRSG